MHVVLFLSNFLNPIFCVCQKGPLFRCSSVGKKKKILYFPHTSIFFTSVSQSVK